MHRSTWGGWFTSYGRSGAAPIRFEVILTLSSPLPARTEKDSAKAKPFSFPVILFDYIFVSAIRAFICIIIFVCAMNRPIIVINDFTAIGATEFATIIMRTTANARL